MDNHRKLATVGLNGATRVKWLLFRALEWAADLRPGLSRRRRLESAPRAPQPDGAAQKRAESHLWVFASTIGELNAIQPFLDRLLEQTGPQPLLLIANQEYYREACLAKYPSARFTAFQSSTVEVDRLVEAFPPHLVLVAEIPCMLSDAPCRFSFVALVRLKQRGVPVCVVNGWLYHDAPASRMDRIEKQLFSRAYVRLIDLYLVQTDAVRGELVAAGADPARVVVTGNIKFDAMTRKPWSPEHARSAGLLSAIRASGRPCIVAGCVTNIDDQTGILDAFKQTHSAVPDALLVLAPRHPEVLERMQELEALLRERQFGYVFRTRLDGDRLEPRIDVLVLDTMGELRDFYAAATLTYVGPNHNVLEPLVFDKLVFVKPGWEASYPSYPVYHLLLAHQALIEVADNQELARQWIEHLRHPGLYQTRVAQIDSVLKRERGASQRGLVLLAARGWLPARDEKEQRT